jgi:uncharacterized repeat protein (TIGR02543 family)
MAAPSISSFTVSRTASGLKFDWVGTFGVFNTDYTSVTITQNTPSVSTNKILTLTNPVSNSGSLSYTSGASTNGYQQTISDSTAYTFLMTVVRKTTGLPNPTKSASIAAVYSVTYNINGGSGSVPSDTTKYEANTAVNVKFDTLPTSVGKMFIGWDTNSSASISSSVPAYRSYGTKTFTMSSANVTLYARYGYGITFTDTGFVGKVTNLPNPIVFTGDGAYTISSQRPTITGDVSGRLFVKWTDGVTTYDPGQSVTLTNLTEVKTLYPVGGYSVSYASGSDGNDVTGIPSDITYVEYGQGVSVAAAPSRPGYTFLGWSSASSLIAADSSFTPTASVTLTASWALIPTYHVYYDLNGGVASSGDISDATAYLDTSSVTVLFSPAPTRVDYTFAGWNTSANGNGSTFIDDPSGNKLTIAGADVTLFAKWTRNVYRVSYSSGQLSTGVSNLPVYADVSSGADFSVSAGFPTHPHYAFTGWSGATIQNGVIATVRSAIILEAQWSRIRRTITFLKGTTGIVDVFPDPSGDYSVDSGANFIIAEYSGYVTPSRTGYTFDGWLSNEAVPTTYANDGILLAVSENITLTAKWIQVSTSHNVYYSAGLASNVSDLPVFDSVITGQTIPISSSTPTRPGYTFAGWVVQGSAQESPYAAGSSLPAISADTVLTAQWTLNTYSVLYEDDADVLDDIEDTTLYLDGSAAKVKLAELAERPHYTFAGWNTAANGSGTMYSSTTSDTIQIAAADVTLYAQWLRRVFTITFNAGVTGLPVPVSLDINSGDSFQVPSAPSGLTRPGFIFSGWLSDEVTPMPYAVSSSVTPVTNMVLTAQWVLNEFTEQQIQTQLQDVTMETVTLQKVATEFAAGVENAPTTSAGKTIVQKVVTNALTQSSTFAGQLVSTMVTAATTSQGRQQIMEGAVSNNVSNIQGRQNAAKIIATVAENAADFATLRDAMKGAIGPLLVPEQVVAEIPVALIPDIISNISDSAKRVSTTQAIVGTTVEKKIAQIADDSISVKNVAANIGAVLSSFGSASVTDTAVSQAIESIRTDTTITTEKQATLLFATSAQLSDDIETKTAYATALANNAGLKTVGPVQATVEHTAALVQAIPAAQRASDEELVGKALTLLFPSAIDVPSDQPIDVDLIPDAFIGISMIPARAYRFKKGTDSAILTFDAENKKLIRGEVQHSVGDMIPIGARDGFVIYAVGSTYGTLISVPGAPQNISLAVGDSEVTLTWQEPDSSGGSPVTSYAIKVNGALVTENIAASTSATIDGLTNGTLYTISVHAVNALGESLESADVDVRICEVNYVAGTENTVSGIPDTEFVLGGTNYDISGATPTRANYTFAGWSDGTTIYAAGSSIPNISGNVTLTAQWSRITYSITFVADVSGVTDLPDPVSIESGETFDISGFSATRLGYTITGWSDGTTVYSVDGNTSFTVTAPVTLTAQWSSPIPTYLVTYATGAGSGVTGMPSQSSVLVNSNGVYIISSSVPSRSNYTFAGWYDGTTTYSAGGVSSFVVSGPVTLTAQWTRITYSITYEAGANSGVTGMPSPISETVNSGDIYNISTSVPSRAGYTFAGWSRGATIYSVGGVSSFVVTESFTLIARWNSDSGGGVVCFLGNAPVMTPTGWARIDSLSVGDLVRTADGRDVAVVRVKHQRIERPSAAVNPYVIPAGQWGATENLPISPRHCVAIPGRGMVEARELGLQQLELRAAFDYYNLELPEWDNMIVAGVEVESLAPKKQVVMTLSELAALAATVPVEKRPSLARLVTVLADGRITVQMSPKTRRMR